MLRSSIGLVALVLTLQSRGEGNYAGALSMDGLGTAVSGHVDGDVLAGHGPVGYGF